jgi:p-aminobenzoyl-glutamate transporter AbgT
MFSNLTSAQKEGLIAGAKLTSVWAAVGVTSWADFAAFMAAMYSLLLVCEFLWKKIIKPGIGWWKARKEAR